MSDAYIYDAVRTPRGKGRKDGALHEVTSVRLSAQVLNAVKERNNLDGHAVEDVIWGNVTQVKEQGGCLARTAVLASELDESIPGLAINRFCASGMEAVNLAANQVRGGAGDGYIAGGVEMMGRVAMGSDGAAIAVDPRVAMDTYFVPAGDQCRHHRHRVRVHPRSGRRAGRGKSETRRCSYGQTTVSPARFVEVTDQNGPDHSGPRRIHAPRHRHADAWRAQCQLPADGRGDAGGSMRWPS